jgi:endonuclease/exonuclease/phosphatase family metal-dependent hydrolase
MMPVDEDLFGHSGMPMRLRIASFNTENLDLPPRAQTPIGQRLVVLRPQLERLDADILCLQEVNSQHPPDGGKIRSFIALDMLLQGTPYAGFHRVHTLSPHGRGPLDIHNLLILSRWPLEQAREIRNDFVKPPRYRPASVAAEEEILWDRPILAADVVLPGGQRLHLFNVHLRAPRAAPIPGQKSGADAWKSVGGWAEGYFMATIKRTGQALELRLAMEALFDRNPQALIAVCGDFNAGLDETPLTVALASEEDTGNGALAGRTLAALERSIDLSRRFSVLHRGRPEMLDHILASRTLLGHFRNFEAHNEMLGDEAFAPIRMERPVESFHAPVAAEFAF